jgi:hypothetical protein
MKLNLLNLLVRISNILRLPETKRAFIVAWNILNRKPDEDGVLLEPFIKDEPIVTERIRCKACKARQQEIEHLRLLLANANEERRRLNRKLLRVLMPKANNSTTSDFKPINRRPSLLEMKKSRENFVRKQNEELEKQVGLNVERTDDSSS